ncbi:MAG: hypothetical protein KBD83_01975 [Gammaproteobacteria bacterium]|nr:hypothetical protein [Gammaproteobacteria bacterium]
MTPVSFYIDPKPEVVVILEHEWFFASINDWSSVQFRIPNIQTCIGVIMTTPTHFAIAHVDDHVGVGELIATMLRKLKAEGDISSSDIKVKIFGGEFFLRPDSPLESYDFINLGSFLIYKEITQALKAEDLPCLHSNHQISPALNGLQLLSLLPFYFFIAKLMKLEDMTSRLTLGMIMFAFACVICNSISLRNLTVEFSPNPHEDASIIEKGVHVELYANQDRIARSEKIGYMSGQEYYLLEASDLAVEIGASSQNLSQSF